MLSKVAVIQRSSYLWWQFACSSFSSSCRWSRLLPYKDVQNMRLSLEHYTKFRTAELKYNQKSPVAVDFSRSDCTDHIPSSPRCWPSQTLRWLPGKTDFNASVPKHKTTCKLFATYFNEHIGDIFYMCLYFHCQCSHRLAQCMSPSSIVDFVAVESLLHDHWSVSISIYSTARPFNRVWLHWCHYPKSFTQPPWKGRRCISKTSVGKSGLNRPFLFFYLKMAIFYARISKYLLVG